MNAKHFLIETCGFAWLGCFGDWTQVLVLIAAECGFESRSWHLCSRATMYATSIAFLRSGVWVPASVEFDILFEKAFKAETVP